MDVLDEIGRAAFEFERINGHRPTRLYLGEEKK